MGPAATPVLLVNAQPARDGTLPLVARSQLRCSLPSPKASQHSCGAHMISTRLMPSELSVLVTTEPWTILSKAGLQDQNTRNVSLGA
eukprot:scaffold311019_cov32-Tisochrysis_lutea.AAC.1